MWRYDGVKVSGGASPKWRFAALERDVQNTPALISVGTLRDGASCVIVAQNLAASGNTVYVGGVQQTVTAEGPTGITFTMDGDPFPYGAILPIQVYVGGDNSTGEPTNALTETLLPPVGISYTNITAEPPADPATRFDSDADPAIGDQIWYEPTDGAVVFSDGTMKQTAGGAPFLAGIYDGIERDTTGALQSFADEPVAPTTIPDVVGLSLAAATALLNGVGLSVVEGTAAYSNTVAVGVVISQYPAAGVGVPPGSAVEVVLSLGVAPLLVPNVIGLTEAAADAAIIAAGFSPLRSYFIVGTGLGSRGYVFGQNPAPGTELTPNGVVTTAVSLGDFSDAATGRKRVTGLGAGV